jgi:hypothetical protein
MGAALIVGSAVPASANAIVNGDFETGDLTGWTAMGAVDVIDGQLYAQCCHGVGSPAGLANHFAVFGGGDRLSDGTLYQSFATTAGTTYSLTFDYGAFSGSNSRTQTMAVSANGTQAFTSRPANRNLGAMFQHFSLSFTASGAAPCSCSRI